MAVVVALEMAVVGSGCQRHQGGGDGCCGEGDGYEGSGVTRGGAQHGLGLGDGWGNVGGTAVGARLNYHDAATTTRTVATSVSPGTANINTSRPELNITKLPAARTRIVNHRIIGNRATNSSNNCNPNNNNNNTNKEMTSTVQRNKQHQ